MMAVTLDTRETQDATSGGRTRLLALARQLVGEKLLFARPTYPEHINLHFGDLIEKSAPRGITLRMGSYTLNPVASFVNLYVAGMDKTLNFHTEVESSPLELAEAEACLLANGRPVVDCVEIIESSTGYSLQLKLSEGTVFTITPNPDDPSVPAAESLPDWELFTPHGRYLTVGPGLKWDYPRCDSPAGK
jgi:hypothetical protein